jgi:hypothetical protein
LLWFSCKINFKLKEDKSKEAYDIFLSFVKLKFPCLNKIRIFFTIDLEDTIFVSVMGIFENFYIIFCCVHWKRCINQWIKSNAFKNIWKNDEIRMKVFILCENIDYWDNKAMECINYFKKIDIKFSIYLFNNYLKTNAKFDKKNWSKTFFKKNVSHFTNNICESFNRILNSFAKLKNLNKKKIIYLLKYTEELIYENYLINFNLIKKDIDTRNDEKFVYSSFDSFEKDFKSLIKEKRTSFKRDKIENDIFNISENDDNNKIEFLESI